MCRLDTLDPPPEGFVRSRPAVRDRLVVCHLVAPLTGIGIRLVKLSLADGGTFDRGPGKRLEVFVVQLRPTYSQDDEAVG